MLEYSRELFPKRLEVSRRQFVVSVGTIAKGALNEMYGLDPSDELVKSFVEEKMTASEPEKASLILAANMLIRQEFEKILTEIAEKIKTPGEIRRKTRKIIREKYQRIDSDPRRNFAYLDSILLTG